LTDLKDVFDIQWIRDKVIQGRYQISEHILRFLLIGKISLEDITNVLLNGEILELHRHPQRDDAFLVFGVSEGRPVHVLCTGKDKDELIILLSYAPSPPLWETPRKRSGSGGRDMADTQRSCFFCNGKIESITVGNFDYRLEGRLYVIKDVPAGLCDQCGEKYVSAEVAEKINKLIEAQAFMGTEEVQVFQYE
jgi:YgiT-type zinc finger domain-containing protein